MSIAILAYHGVTKSTSRGIENCEQKHISLSVFEQQIRFLATQMVPISICTMIQMLRQEIQLRENSVVITFDDGYENNYSTAVPVLKQYGIPATFFIATSFIESGQVYWVDLVEHYINMTDLKLLVLDSLSMEVPLESNTQRITAVKQIKKVCKYLPSQERELVIEELKEMSGVLSSPLSVENYRCMTWENLENLTQEPLFTLGAHTVNHEVLSRLSDTQLEREIDESRKILGQTLSIEVTSFAYPNGLEGDYDARSIEYLVRLGFECAVTSIEGYNSPNDSLLELHRIPPQKLVCL